MPVMNPVKYSKELVGKVKEIYPTYEEMNAMAKNGVYFLGRLLCDSIPNGISPDEVLKATSLDELKQKALINKAKSDLYKIWLKETS